MSRLSGPIRAAVWKVRQAVGRRLHRAAQLCLPDVFYEFAVQPFVPYEYVHAAAIRDLRYLGEPRDGPLHVVVVGLCRGEELAEMAAANPDRTFRFRAFEPSPEHVRHAEAELRRVGEMANVLGVELSPVAVGASRGSATMYETSVVGNGSLLPLDPSAEGIVQTATFAVDVVTLDDVLAGERVDLLSIDVQGFELQVLAGGEAVLRRTQAVLIEVGAGAPSYEGGATFEAVDDVLKRAGFSLFHLGLDVLTWNGNALYLRQGEYVATSSVGGASHEGIGDAMTERLS